MTALISALKSTSILGPASLRRMTINIVEEQHISRSADADLVKSLKTHFDFAGEN